MKVAIIGGGISGIAAALHLRRHAELAVFESGRFGGKIQTLPLDERQVDCGPDSFITRDPTALELCNELGIDDLVAPKTSGAKIWLNGRLRALPSGLALGIPTRFLPLMASGVLSPIGSLRALGDWVLPHSAPVEDLSVYELIARRMGSQVAERLVDPLLGSIHAASIEELSARAVVPELAASSERRRTLAGALRYTSFIPPGFMAPRSGMSTIVERAIQELDRAKVSRVSMDVSAVRRVGRRWGVDPEGELYDAIILATPAQVSARLLGEHCPGGLRRIDTASVAVVTLSCIGIEIPPGYSGFLVPRSEGWLTTACSFGTAKWPHWSDGSYDVLRASVGSFSDRRSLAMDDDALVTAVCGELDQAIPGAGSPRQSRVSRWPHSFPLYRVGHTVLVREVTSTMRAQFPGVYLCGASYSGAGIAACVRSARQAADEVLKDLAVSV